MTVIAWKLMQWLPLQEREKGSGILRFWENEPRREWSQNVKGGRLHSNDGREKNEFSSKQEELVTHGTCKWRVHRASGHLDISMNPYSRWTAAPAETIWVCPSQYQVCWWTACEVMGCRQCCWCWEEGAPARLQVSTGQCACQLDPDRVSPGDNCGI